MNQEYLKHVYNNSAFQDSRWDISIYWSLDMVRSLGELEITRFHHDKMAQLSVAQKLAFTEEQKSYMNVDQLDAITVSN